MPFGSNHPDKTLGMSKLAQHHIPSVDENFGFRFAGLYPGMHMGHTGMLTRIVDFVLMGYKAMC